MPRVPFPAAPTVGLSVPGMVPMQAPGVQPVEDQTGKQLQQFGAQTFELGMGLWKISQEEQDQIDTAQAKELDNQLAEAYRGVVQDFGNKVGKDAVDNRDAVMEALQKKRKEIEGKATTPGQKAMVGLYSDRRTMAAAAEVTEHFQKQQRTWNLGVSQARAQGFGVDAARHAAAGDWGKYDSAKGAMDAEVLSGLQMQGMPPDSEPAQMLLLKRRTELHSSIAETLAGQNPQAAKDYLDRTEREIEPDILASLQDKVQRYNTKDIGLRTAMSLAGAGTILDQVDSAKRMFADGKLTAEQYHETVQNLTQDDARLRQTEVFERNKALLDAQTHAQKFRGGADPNRIGPPAPGEFVPLPPELEQRLDRFGARDSYDLWLQGGGQWITTAVGRDALLLWGDKQWESFGTEGHLVGALRNHLSDDDLGRVVKKWKESRTPPEKGALTEATKTALAKKSAIDYGIVKTVNEKDWSDAESEKMLRWSLALSDEADRLAGEGGKPGQAEYEKAAKVLGGMSFEVEGEKVLLATANKSELANGVWKTPAGDIDAKSVDAVREEVLGIFAKRQIPEDRITEDMVAHQARYLIDERAKRSQAQAAAESRKRIEAEKFLTDQFRTAMAMPQNRGSRRMAADWVAKTWSENVKRMGMEPTDARTFLSAMAGDDPQQGAKGPDMDLAWEAEKRRRLAAYGKDYYGDGVRWVGVNKKMEAWDRTMFLGSEAARQTNAEKWPNDPDFFYENWHRLDYGRTGGRIPTREEASRTNPYADPNYKAPEIDVRRMIEEMAR